MPWEADSKGGDARDHFKYKYHPGGDPKNPPKDAPSALHSVIIPNVNLPKVGKLFLLLSNSMILIICITGGGNNWYKRID